MDLRNHGVFISIIVPNSLINNLKVTHRFFVYLTIMIFLIILPFYTIYLVLVRMSFILFFRQGGFFLPHSFSKNDLQGLYYMILIKCLKKKVISRTLFIFTLRVTKTFLLLTVVGKISWELYVSTNFLQDFSYSIIHSCDV